MPKSSVVTLEVASRIDALNGVKLTVAAIAKHVRRSVSTVRKVIRLGVEHYRGAREIDKSATDRVQARRDRILELLEEKITRPCGRKLDDIEVVGRRYGTLTALQAKLRQEGITVSRATLCRDARTLGVRCLTRPRVAQNSKHKNADRVRAAKRMVRLSPRRFIFCDETWSNSNDNCYHKELTPPGDIPTPRLFMARAKCRIMVWAAIGYGYKSELVFFEKHGEDGSASITGQRYSLRCLRHIRMALNRDKQKLVFVQDGARPHLAAGRTLKAEGYAVATWPPYSPDLNPIETVWNDLKRRVAKKGPTSTAALKKATKEAWDELPQSIIDNHVLGFQARLKRCLERKGVPT